MLISLLSMMAMAQDAGDIAAPPVQIRKNPACTCAAEAEQDLLTLRGLVVDAEITLAPDGRSPNERQATIFDIKPNNDSDVEGRTRIWHSTKKSNCGLTFDYGLQYSLIVRRTEEGALETDACLMPEAGSAS